MKRIFTISILFLLMLSMFIPSGMDLVGETQAAASVSVTLTSNPKFWVDANKCGPQGPRGAWMSFIIENNGTVDLDFVTITFNGFDLPVYVDPVDNVRLFHSIPVGGKVPAFYYVDYAEVCLGTLVGNLSNYSVTVDSPTLAAPFVYPGQVSTDTLITALAAGVLQSTAIGPGIWVGQLLKQTVVFDYGNNKGMFFQPAGQALFSESSYRLVQTEVRDLVNITLVDDPFNRLFFPDADTKGGTLTVDFYWEVINIAPVENVTPWAAAQSGQQFKYTGFGATQNFPIPEPPLTIEKSVTPTYFATPTSPGYLGDLGIVRYTINIYNDATVEILLNEIHDTLPGNLETPDCVKIVDPFYYSTNSIIDELSSYDWPATGEDGYVEWIGLISDDRTTSSYMVPAGTVTQADPLIIAPGVLTLQYTADVSACAEDDTYTNIVTAMYGDNIVIGPVEASFIIGYDPTAITLPSDPQAEVDQDIHITWETVNEVDLVGFKLFRQSLGTPLELIYQVKAALAGQLMGTTYEFVDRTSQPGVMYQYWLEVSYRDGTSGIVTDFLKPVSVQSPFKTYLPLFVR